MNVKNLQLDYAAATGGTAPCILAEISEPSEFTKDGKPTGKSSGDGRFVIVCPARRWEKISVRVPGQPPSISQDDVDARAAITPVKVSFDNFVAKLYQDRNGQYQMSATAEHATLHVDGKDLE